MGMDKALDPPKYSRFRKFAPAGAIAALLVGALIFFAPESGKSFRTTGGRLAISTAASGQFEDFIPVRGQVTPLRTVYLDAIEGGRVERVFVEDGSVVEAGQPLVELSNTALQLDVISREAQVTEQLNNMHTLELQLERNRLDHKRNMVEIDYQIVRLARDLERLTELHARGDVSEAELDRISDEHDYYVKRRAVTVESMESDLRLQGAQKRMLEESVSMLRKNLAFARRNLETLSVRAPVSGRLTSLNAEIGQSLQPGERLGQIDDPERYKVTALVDEFYLGRVAIEQTAGLTVGRDHFPLTVSKIYPQVSNGQFEVDLVFAAEQPARVQRGQTVQMRLVLGDPAPALLIPYGAFFQDTGGSWLFVVTPDGSRAVRRNVRLGRRNARFIEVLDGLDVGERVITSPYTGFVDMDRLELEDVGEQSLATVN